MALSSESCWRTKRTAQRANCMFRTGRTEVVELPDDEGLREGKVLEDGEAEAVGDAVCVAAAPAESVGDEMPAACAPPSALPVLVVLLLLAVVDDVYPSYTSPCEVTGLLPPVCTYVMTGELATSGTGTGEGARFASLAALLLGAPWLFPLNVTSAFCVEQPVFPVLKAFHTAAESSGIENSEDPWASKAGMAVPIVVLPLVSKPGRLAVVHPESGCNWQVDPA